LELLSGRSRGFRIGRSFFRHLPSPPRCKLCAAPFGGGGGQVMRLVGKKPWPKNPKYCTTCLSNLEKHRGGAEIDCTLLFADVRGSTALAERIRPAEFRALMDRFYAAATRVLIEHDAFVDKFVGDEVVAMFLPALAGEVHASRAVDASRALVPAIQAIDPDTELPIGIGVHSGLSFVGTVGVAGDLEFSALGDTVNTAARLASVAGAGEVLISLATADAAGLDPSGRKIRSLALKGKSAPFTVVVLTPQGAAKSPPPTR
jgi:adenylate cyclase